MSMRHSVVDIVTPQQSTETQFVFFSGKGGVGKSTVSCSTAAWLAQRGFETLIVTTDPAPNVGDIFGQNVGHEVTPVSGYENLSAIEIDPDTAAEEYRTQVLEPIADSVDDEELQTIRDQLDSPCVDEVAAFDKFTEFMSSDTYDVVVFDTAPTGHTIRLMELPSDWSEELDHGGNTCIGPAAALEDTKERYEDAVDTLQSDQHSSFVFVSRPRDTAIEEVRTSSSELSDLGIKTDLIVLNGYLPEEVCDNQFLRQQYTTEQSLITQLKDDFPDIPVETYPLQPTEITDNTLLVDVAETLYEDNSPSVNVKTEQPDDIPPASTQIDTGGIIEEITPDTDTRYLFFAGKGGVGKSTVAATTATALANAEYETLVVTTDPASHLSEIFGERVTTEPTSLSQPNLYAARIDQQKAYEEYRIQIREQVRKRVQRGNNDSIDLDEVLAQVEEELNSPCAKEMASLEKFIEYFNKDFDIVVFDTAPTGHTLRLLELPSDWSGFLNLGSLTKTSASDATKYDDVVDAMQNPQKTSVIFVMYPEHTPIIEARRAADDLREQVDIEPAAIAVNYLLPYSHSDNAFFQRRRKQQYSYLNNIADQFDVPAMLVPQRIDSPQGIDELQSFGDQITGLDGLG
ncbi:TRC40/GET3/ArsA family transport-energizing ATPase [Salinarchaeum sp. IM2453]|uniref:arsenical pump-driving ATPase n=1 Tax=Salinarchaeum sp. IM2453 TaxID=2862870 RepID=UPI001C83C425|nr:arsenical pump-driving ATPase [Salinarchaeum sp. IM2453]QZA87664.1 TRC40/GET3/ArsA family transport-energizing ATPase [Salinarchaeum sp. IM2453]